MVQTGVIHIKAIQIEVIHIAAIQVEVIRIEVIKIVVYRITVPQSEELQFKVCWITLQSEVCQIAVLQI